MLNLSRKAGESIYIGGGIKVTILGVNGNQVKICVYAPEGVVILREELYHKGNDTEALRQNVNAKWEQQYSANFL